MGTSQQGHHAKTSQAHTAEVMSTLQTHDGVAGRSASFRSSTPAFRMTAPTPTCRSRRSRARGWWTGWRTCWCWTLADRAVASQGKPIVRWRRGWQCHDLRDVESRPLPLFDFVHISQRPQIAAALAPRSTETRRSYADLIRQPSPSAAPGTGTRTSAIGATAQRAPSHPSTAGERHAPCYGPWHRTEPMSRGKLTTSRADPDGCPKDRANVGATEEVSALGTVARRNQDDRAALDLRLAQILATALVRAFRDENAASCPRGELPDSTREGA